jgi:hypothetical protein
MMIRSFTALLLLLCAVWSGMIAAAELHRATRLGNPATRFANPLKTPEDLRATLLKESLQDDVLKVLRMSDYLGDINDFRNAAANANIRELSIPTGSILPAMSTRKRGKVDLLRNVLWAGRKPIDAYEFSFISGERRYRVITPKACSNFWVEEQLPPPQATLTMTCEAPTEAPSHKTITHCNTLSNSGELSENLAMLSLPIPAGMKLESTEPEANTLDATQATWRFENFAPGAKQTVCATFSPGRIGDTLFRSAAVGQRASGVATECTSRIFGLPAVLLEVIDLADPVLVGTDVIYVIRVLNQGTIPLTNLKIVARTEAGQSFVSGSGASEVAAGSEAMINPGIIALLNPQQEIEWRIVVKAEQAGDMRFVVALAADQFARPVMETEATFQY